MKLRIRGNSVRLRVSQSELDELQARGSVADTVRFAPASALTYCLDVSTADTVQADFAERQLRVVLPQAVFERWLAPEQVSITAEQSIGGAEVLQILVEKDFACLVPRGGEDDSDTFPNPAKKSDSH
jgi:hypothetical protein